MKKIVSIILGLALGMASCIKDNVSQISLYPDSVIVKNFIGFGVQWDPYPHADTESAEWGRLMTDEKWERVFTRLDYMKPCLVRVLDQANWRYLKGFDEKGIPVLDFNTAEEKALEKLLGYCQRSGAVVMLGEWGCPYMVHDTGAGFSGILKGANDPVWIDMIVKHLEYLIIEKGLTCIRYFNLVNEPNGYWASTDGNWKEWSEGVKLLSEAIKRKGLDEYVSIAGPDAVAHFDHETEKPSGMGWMERSILDLKDEIGLLDLHAYFDLSIIREEKFDSIYGSLALLAKDAGKQIVFGEVGYEKMTDENQARVRETPCTSTDSYLGIYDYQHGVDVADAAIQIMRAGFHGAAAWALDDAMHTNNDNGDKNNLKRWGMWNSLGTELCNNPEDENIRPWFFTWSLLCRYIEPGSDIVEVKEPQVKGVRLAAAKKNGEYSLVLVNQSNKTVVLTLKRNEALKDKVFREFHYQENNYKVDINGFPAPQKKDIDLNKDELLIEMPAHSFKMFTTYKF